MCKKSLNRDPDFIDVKKLKAGMILQPWFFSEYKPEQGNYSKCTGTRTIRKLDGDLVYSSADDSGYVDVWTAEMFTYYTLLK